MSNEVTVDRKVVDSFIVNKTDGHTPEGWFITNTKERWSSDKIYLLPDGSCLKSYLAEFRRNWYNENLASLRSPDGKFGFADVYGKTQRFIFPDAYDIIDFRVPNKGEIWYSFDNGIDVGSPSWYHGSGNRLILQPKVVQKEEASLMNNELRSAYLALQAASGIEVGDIVKVLRTAKNNEMGWGEFWDKEMDSFVGGKHKVKAIYKTPECGITIEEWNFPFFVLELVSKAPKTVKVKLNDSYEAVVSLDKVQVGCQTFSTSKIEELAKALASLQN
jgi:hypothetical protein